MNTSFRLISSLEKCFPDTEVAALAEHKAITALRGHDAVAALIEDTLDAPLSFAECPFDTESLLAMRERINRAIAAASGVGK